MRSFLQISSLLFLCWMLSAASCKKTSEEKSALSQKKANQALFPNEAKSSAWRLYEHYDPYNKGKVDTISEESASILTFSTDGTFTEKEGELKSEGKWYLDKNATHLALVYTNQTGTPVPKENQKIEFRTELRKIDAEQLILANQGRHGWVERRYKAVR